MSTTKFTNYQVKRGVLRIPSSFTGAKDGTFARRSDFLRPGDAIPEGLIGSDRELRRLLADGIISEIATPAVAAAAQAQAQKHMSRWAMDPAQLGDKDLEDLLVMIQDIDPQYPLDGMDEDAARRLLSKDFDPDIDRPQRPEVSAKDAVSRLTVEPKVRDVGSKPLSQRGADALAQLQQRAETPEAAGGASDEAEVEDDSPEDPEPQAADQGAQSQG